MGKNVIILTVGLSGSSVLTNLISRAGYWSGGDTFKKTEYDTHENAELVALNKALLEHANIGEKFTMAFEQDYIDKVTALRDTVDLTPYRALVERCSQHQPWVWKDPRLWLSIRFWQPLLPLDDIQFIVQTREPLQAWISTTIRRQIQTYAYSKRYTDAVRGSILQFLSEHNKDFLELTFEDLVCRPESTIARLNAFLDAELTLDDLTHVYNKPLRKKAHGSANFSKAALIYLKNYGERYK